MQHPHGQGKTQPSPVWHRQTVRLSRSNSMAKQKPVFSQNCSRGLTECYATAEELNNQLPITACTYISFSFFKEPKTGS